MNYVVVVHQEVFGQTKRKMLVIEHKSAEQAAAIVTKAGLDVQEVWSTDKNPTMLLVKREGQLVDPNTVQAVDEDYIEFE